MRAPEQHGTQPRRSNRGKFDGYHSPHGNGENEGLFDHQAVKQVECILGHPRYRVRPRGFSRQPCSPVVEENASVMIFEKRDLAAPRPGGSPKPANEKKRKSLAVDFIMEIDIPDFHERHVCPLSGGNASS
jgi:hypothetical protein